MIGKKTANWTVGKIMVVLVLAAQPATAHAIGACDAQKRMGPRDHAPLAIGDSVMLGAAERLARHGIRVNARGCRQMRAGLDILARHRHRRVVILEMGTNWTVTRADLRRALRLLSPRSRLVLVTPAAGADARDAAVMRTVARRHPDRVCLADWRRRAAGHGSWAPGDSIHLSVSGAIAFVRMLKPYRRLIRHPRAACPGS